MYDPKIEELINAALADGVLTEKEKQVLFKKAESMGIDLDEFEMVLQSKLYDKQKEIDKAKAESTASPKSNKMGDIKKCPVCGAIVSSYQATCKECGYEFSDLKANSSSQLLANKLEEARNKIDRSTFKGIGAQEEYDEAVFNLQQEIITTFPIPSTKADLFEFLASLEPRTKDSDSYSQKFRECYRKAELLFPGDPMFTPFAETLQELKRKEEEWEAEQKKGCLRSFFGGCFGMIAGFVMLGGASLAILLLLIP